MSGDEHLQRAYIFCGALLIVGLALMIWPEEQRLIAWMLITFSSGWLGFEIGLTRGKREG